MAYFSVRSSHQCLRGTSLSIHCTDQCFLNKGSYAPENGWKNKTASASLCSFELLWTRQSGHTVMWKDNDGCIVMAQCQPRVNWVTRILTYDHEHNAACMTVVTLTSVDTVTVWKTSFFFQLMQQMIYRVSMSVGQHSALCGGVPRRRQAGLTYWWKRLPLLCGLTWRAWRRRQREDDDRIELCFKHRLPPFCQLMQKLPVQLPPLPTEHLWVLLCAITLHNAALSSVQSRLTSCRDTVHPGLLMWRLA